MRNPVCQNTARIDTPSAASSSGSTASAACTNVGYIESCKESIVPSTTYAEPSSDRSITAASDTSIGRMPMPRMTVAPSRMMPLVASALFAMRPSSRASRILRGVASSVRSPRSSAMRASECKEACDRCVSAAQECFMNGRKPAENREAADDETHGKSDAHHVELRNAA